MDTTVTIKGLSLLTIFSDANSKRQNKIHGLQILFTHICTASVSMNTYQPELQSVMLSVVIEPKSLGNSSIVSFKYTLTKSIHPNLSRLVKIV